MTDHPPPLPPIGVRVPVYVRTVSPFHLWSDSRAISDWELVSVSVPLGLSPEQPARIGGGE